MRRPFLLLLAIGFLLAAGGTARAQTYDISDYLMMTPGSSKTVRSYDLQPGSAYHVFGGNTYISGVDPYHPEQHGYIDLGKARETESFTGTYSYYVVVCYEKNIVFVDTVEGSNGAFYQTFATGNTYEHQNVGGAPDGLTCCLGAKYHAEAGGYVLIDASGAGLTGITVHIDQAGRYPWLMKNAVDSFGSYIVHRDYEHDGTNWVEGFQSFFELTPTHFRVVAEREFDGGQWHLAKFQPAISIPRSLPLNKVSGSVGDYVVGGKSVPYVFTFKFIADNITATTPAGTYTNCVKAMIMMQVGTDSFTSIEIMAPGMGDVQSWDTGLEEDQGEIFMDSDYSEIIP